VNIPPRLRQIAIVGGVESLGVVLSGVAGLLIVNVLPKDQYAAYTFLIACMTLVLGVTDLGLSHCCLPVVGQRSREVPWVVGACQQVFRKRWLLLGLGLVIVVPYWFYTSREHGWSGGGYFLGSALMLSVVLLALREHYASTVLVILSHISTLNRIGFTSNIVRIAFIAIVLLLPITSWSMAGIVAATAAASFVSVTLYRRAFRSRQIADSRLDAADAKRVDAHVIKIAKPLVLPAIFFQVQGVITIFLVSILGTSSMLAEVGAFGRLAMVLLVVDRVTGTLLFPVLARAPEGPALASTVVRVHALYLLAMALMELSAILLPQYWIILLGQQYRSMTPYVWIVFLATMLSNASNLAFRTLTVRGATSKQGYGVAYIVAVQALYLWVFGAADLRAALGFNLATAAAHASYQYLLLAMRLPEWRRQAPAAESTS
jgi:O-antigen/teichoic acid export membrane protein